MKTGTARSGPTRLKPPVTKWAAAMHRLPVMWAVNNPPRARKPMTSTAPAVVLRTAGSNQLLSRRVSQDFIELAVTPCTVLHDTFSIYQCIRCHTHRADKSNSHIFTLAG